MVTSYLMLYTRLSSTQGRYRCLTAVSMGSARRGESCGMAAALAGENTLMASVSTRREVVLLGYAMAAASKERINVSLVPLAPPISFQPLGLCLAYSGRTVGHRETVGVMNRIGKTCVFTPRELRGF